jgi:hypothetical protein
LVIGFNKLATASKDYAVTVIRTALGQVFSEHFGFPANHSTNFSIIIITRGWHNRPIDGRSAECTLDSTPHYTNLKKTVAW